MSQTPATSATTSNWRSIGMSFVTHLFLVLFLFLFSFSAPRKGTEGELRRTGIVLAVNETENETEYLTENSASAEVEEAEEATQSNPADAPPPGLAIETQQNNRPELPGFEAFENTTTDVNQMVEGDGETGLDHQHELSAEELKLIEADRRAFEARAPKGPATTVSVFGTGGLQGRSFVFVLDRSKSMGMQGLGVIQAARKELTQAINQLEPHHEFQIVGYHERTVTMNERNLLPATEKNKQEVPKYIGGMAAFGATNHENGLVAAAAFQPDIVVLMTDGGYPELHDGKLNMLKGFFRGTQVHCIQFGLGSNQQTTNFMKKLAAQNGGTFRYIDVTEWKKDQN